MLTARTAASATAALGPACASYAGGLYYSEDHIGTVAITNLELGVNLRDSLTVSPVRREHNLFNRYPNQVIARTTPRSKRRASTMPRWRSTPRSRPSGSMEVFTTRACVISSGAYGGKQQRGCRLPVRQ